MHLLALSGSRHEGSFNTMASARQDLAPVGVTIELYDRRGRPVALQPDVASVASPDVVQRLQRQAGAAGRLVIACSEYAQGLPGSVQNALDWFVGSGDCPRNPVILVNTARRA